MITEERLNELTNVEIVEMIDTLNGIISHERCYLSLCYKDRRQLRKRLEDNHRIKTKI